VTEVVSVIHTGCGGVAFRVNRRPARTDPMDPSTVVWPENKIKQGDFVVCFSCNQQISFGDIVIEGGFIEDQQTEETE